MSYMEKWNYIVNRYKENSKSNENIIQKEWEGYFSEIFGYKKYLNEIDAQRSITIGSHKRAIPDIIIRDNFNDLFDVELKQYNLEHNENFEEQLISYMNLLHISVGIIICNKIYIYVYNYAEKTIKKTSIDFVKNNVDGEKFVEMFSKETFSKKSVENFIDEKNKTSENIKKIKNDISSEYVISLVKKDMLQKGYTNEEVDKALEKINFNVSKKQELGIKTIAETSTITSKEDFIKTTGKDTTKYRFENAIYGKGRLVLAVVKAYVRDNPNVTREELKIVFYPSLQSSKLGVVQNIEDTPKICKVPKDRYYLNEIINLINGDICVCTQWGAPNLYKFIERAAKLGYIIEEAQ